MKKTWLRDAVLIAALLLIALGARLLLHTGEPGGEVVVTIAGAEVGRYSLAADLTLTFGDADYNVLTIQNGAASITGANCGDHTCVRTGDISLAGERIICLPHELVVEVVGGEMSGVDAVTG